MERNTILTFSLVLFLISNSIGVKKAYYSENDSRKVPIVHIEGVLGHRVQLACDITPKRRDDTVYMILWFREDVGKPFYTFDVRGRGMKTAKTTSTKSGFDRRADFQAGSSPAYLVVSDLQLSDEGVYRCRVDYRYSPTRNAQVNLTVVVPPSPPIIYDEMGQEVSSVIGPYVEGSDVRLTCKVHGGKPEPLVSWYVNGALEDGTFHSDRYGNVINELVFRGLNRSHLNSQFSCRATNTKLIQPIEKSLALDLNLRPLYVKVQTKPMDRLAAGHEYRLVCETAGSKPPAVLKWFVSGKEMTMAETQDKDGGNVTQSTFLFVPTPKDNGARISCRAENPWLNRTMVPTYPQSQHFALLEESWTINVVYLPQVKLSLGSTLRPLEIKEGTDVYFECRILANPKITKLAWFFNEEELRHTPTSGIIMSNQSLVLQGISRKSMGNYTCIATNAEGFTQSNPVYLRVQYSPICRRDVGLTVGAVKGELIALPCSVDSAPPVLRYEWEFHGNGGESVVPSGGRELSQGDVSRFLYTPTLDAEFGTFLCWGTNDIGRQVQPCVFHVVPAVKPHPLENCTVVNQSLSMIHIECSSVRELPPVPNPHQPLFRIMHGDNPSDPLSHHNPSSHSSDPIHYGLFPEYYIMEVWDLRHHSLRKNLSSETPVFVLKGLSPGSFLKFILYAANSHGKSESNVIEAIIGGGDAEKHTILGASTSHVEFFPMAALICSIVGIVFILFVVILFRSRFTNSSHPTTTNHNRHLRTPTTTTTLHSQSALGKPNSLILTSGATTTTHSDDNPDIILQMKNGKNLSEGDFSGSSTLNSRKGGGGGFPSSYSHPHPHPYPVHHVVPKSNYVQDYSGGSAYHSIPAHDLNTIYIRDKLHDMEIPESCV